MRFLSTRRALAAASVLAVSSAYGLVQYPGSAPVPSHLKTGFETISVSDAKAWLGYLAGPECAGRGSGQPGFQKAADFMAAKFQEFGLKPVGDEDTYFQHVPFVRSRVKPGGVALTANGQGLGVEGAVAFQSLPADLDLEAEVVFVKAVGQDAALEDASVLQGRIVVLASRNPGAPLRRQVFGARPAAMLNVAQAVLEDQWSVRPASARGGGRFGGTAQGSISVDGARKLATALGVDAALASPDGGTSVGAEAKAGTGRVRVTAKVETEEIGVPNVVALLEGSDPVLKNEIVGIGAHLDHMGQRGEAIYYGADDDGSGSTGVLAVAKAFASNPVKPKRSILFMAFCGEEMGLIGSGHYVNNPVFPLENMVCLLQMDMIGRNEQHGDEKAEDNLDTIHIVGSKRISTQLHEMVLAANRYLSFKFEYDEENVYTRSDHYRFAQKGVPIAFLFSGFHPDYHQPTDTVEKINFEKLTNAAKLFYITAFMAADMDGRLKKDGAGG